MKKNKKIIIVAGATATGKTATSIELAKAANAEIVNFDSLLFYKELNIGTAKPTKDEQSSIIHHMIDTHSISNPINAADYAKQALPIIDAIHEKGKNVVLVGGSGFYLQALLHGMFDSKTTKKEVTDKSNQLYTTEGIQPFIQILQREDPLSYEKYHANDHYRIRRAVEHFWTTGTSFATAREAMLKKKLDTPYIREDWNIHFICLDIPKETHQAIIEKRAQGMLESGLVQEVETLLAQGYSLSNKPLKSIGYKETIDYINGVFKDREEYIERLVINTRQLAKAQRTWFKKIERNEYNVLEDRALIQKDLELFLQENK